MPPVITSTLDSHCHLPTPDIASKLGQITAKSKHPNADRYFCNATCEKDWQAMLGLAAKERTIVPFLGVHPWFAETVIPGWAERLLSLLQQTSSGIGETGLDSCCHVNFDRQQQVFLIQLQIASELQRPLVIHCVKAWGRLLEILERFIGPRPTIMIHSFSGSGETLRRLIAIDCFISFSPKLATNNRLHPLFMATPLTHLLLETDTAWCPVQIIAPDRHDLPSEPATITQLYQVAATLRGKTLPEFCQQISKNGDIFTNTIFPR